MKETVIEIATILSHRTKEGMINFKLNNEETQWDIRKAKQIRDMLSEAIEAAISDEMIYKFFREKIGFSDEKACMVLIDFREIRQGSRETVFPQ